MTDTKRRRAGLPISSPFRRGSIEVLHCDRPDHPEPMYVIPLSGQVHLTSSEAVLAVLPVGDAMTLSLVLQEALAHPTVNGDASTTIRESWCEAVLVEEQTLLANLKRLSKQAPDIIDDFKSGDLSPSNQITYAVRLMHLAETLMIHGKARERMADEQGSV